MDGMDEITTTTDTLIAEVTPDSVKMETINPEQFGIKLSTMNEVRGGDAAANAVIVRSVLGGEQGARRNVVLLNAAYALTAAGKVSSPEDGLIMAAEAIDSGRALQQLEKLAALTNLG
jgi:anthranilate phosphoribosyltransferase